MLKLAIFPIILLTSFLKSLDGISRISAFAVFFIMITILSVLVIFIKARILGSVEAMVDGVDTLIEVEPVGQLLWPVHR